ncbi:MAG: endo-1,4-beta-xylanase [Spirochaetales bacterium]|nr:endo-1,4-beta-xylanase [Spirochaetales bacterium]
MNPLSSLSILSVPGLAGDKTDDVEAALSPAAIEKRIRELRMGVITVKAAPGARVRVTQIRHEFLFGTAVANGLAENDASSFPGEERKRFLEILSQNFNYAVHENALKWYDCEKAPGVVDYSVADRIWEYCRGLGIPMRGHCIYWEKEKCCMDWLKPLTPEQLRAAVVRRGLDVTRHFKGRISEFDLNNEMVNGDFFRRRLGSGVVNEMAWIAKAGNPDAVLFMNDYGILCDGGFNIESYESQIETLLSSGVPLGGVGVQAHSGTNTESPMNPVHVQKTLDRFSRFNLPIKITECLFDVGDEKTQAEQLRTVFPIYFAHPRIEAVLMWGFWAGSHWRPWAALWRTDWSITPQGEAFRDLVFNRWWTKAEGKTDKSGSFETKAFFGDYEITVDDSVKKVSLSKHEKTLQVSFA